MMFLIIVLCVGAVYLFIKTYQKEMKDNAERKAKEVHKEEPVPVPTQEADRVEKAQKNQA